MALNLFEKLKNALNSNTTTNVDTYTNDGMNLSGVNNIQNARGTAKVETSTISTPRNDASNLAGTNNIQSARGTSTKSVQNNVQRNNDVYESTPSQGKTVSTNTVKNNIQTYQPVLSSVADESNRKIQSTISSIGNAFNNVIEQGKANQENFYNDRNNKLNELKRNEANDYLKTKADARNQRINENPDYELNLVEYQDANGNKVGGYEYNQLIQDHNAQLENLYRSFDELEKQYQYDKDYDKYVVGYNELYNKYNRLKEDEIALNQYQAQYNESVIEEYENNKKRMAELISVGNDIKKQYGTTRQGKDLINQEYLALKARNEELKALYDDVMSLKQEDYYNHVLENGTEKEVQNLESYIASQDDSFVFNRIKKLGSAITTPAYAVTSLVDITADLLGDRYGAIVENVANNLYEKGYIDDVDFDKLSVVARDLKSFEYDNENNMSQKLREFREKINLEVHSGDKSSLEMIAGDVMDSAIENYARNMMLGQAGTYAMALSQFGDSYYENIEKGYSNGVSLLNAIAKAYITYWSENLTTQRYFEMLGATAGMNLDSQFFSILAQNYIQMVPQEMLEEGAEYIAGYLADVATDAMQPGVYSPEFRAGDLIKGSLMAMGSTILSATGGAITSSIAMENEIPNINTGQEYEQFNVELNKIKEQYDLESDIEVKARLKQFINLAEGRKLQYEEKSKLVNKVRLASDVVMDIDQGEANKTYKSSLVPEALSLSDEQEKVDYETAEATKFLREASISVLNQKGIIMNPDEYLLMDARQRNVINKISESFNKIEGNNIQLRFSTNAPKGGEYGVDAQTGQAYILVNPNSQTLTEDIFKHEIIHTIFETDLRNDLQELSDSILGKTKEAKKEKLRNAGYSEGSLEEELVSYVMQNQYDLNTFLKELGKKDNNVLQKLFNLVSDFTSQIKGHTQAENLAIEIANAYREIMNEPRLTTSGAMLNNDVNGKLQEENIRTVQTVRDIDSSYYDRRENGQLGNYSEEQARYDGLFDRYINELLSQRSNKNAIDSKLTEEDVKLLGDDYVVIKNGLVGLKPKTIKYLIKNKGEFGDNVYLAFIDPIQHPYLTGQGYYDNNRDELFLENRWFTNRIEDDVDYGKLSKNINGIEEDYDGGSEAQKYSLNFKKDANGNFVNIGHEGRHRSIALVKDGVHRIPVVMVFDSDDDLSGKEVQVYPHITGYGGDRLAKDRSTIISNLIPLDNEHYDELVDTFSKGKDFDVLLNKDIQLKDQAKQNLVNFLNREDIIEDLDLLIGYTGINSNVKDLDLNSQRAKKTREEVLNNSIEDLIDSIDDTFQDYLEGEEITLDEVDLEDLWWVYGDPYHVEGSAFENISYDGRLDEFADLAVEYIKEKYRIGANDAPVAYANKDIDLNNNLANKLSGITDVKLDDELNEMINLAESQIAFTGELTDQMRGALAQKLYESTYYEMEGYDEITPTDINRFLRENPIRWATLKGDNNLSLVEFQKEHPGVKFSKDGGKDWDVIAMDFNEQFPGLIDPEMINSPVDFLDELQTLKEQLSKYNGTQRIDPGNYEQFYKQYDKIIDNFIKENSPKLSQPREMSDARMKSLDRQRELFRNSVSEWVRDYDVVRDKYDAFDKKAFDDAMADVYIIGEVTPETQAELKESIIRNDFEGYYVNGKADQYIEDFVNEAVDYYVLESEYLVDQRYRDKIAKTANIINQAKSQMYEEDYDRSETAKLINDLAKLQKGRDYDAVYEDVEYIVENIDNKKNVFYNRDLKEYNDLVSGNNKVLREKLYDVIESPIRHAQAQELETLQKYKKEFTDLQKETGIKMYSDEDNAIGWIIEGKTQDGTPYDITDLKRDFPNKWQDIMKVVEYYKPLMEKWYNEEITEKERIYGDVEYQNEVKTAKLENNLESAKAILEKRGQDLKKNPNPKTQAGYAKAQKAVEMAQKKLNAQLEKNLQHSDTRKQYTPHRENYFHHTNEVKFTKNAKAFFEMLKSGIGRQNNIPTELAGRTDITKPRTTNQSYMWKQGQTNYSTSGFASLQHRLHEHANAMAFDSVVSYLRNVENSIEELDADNNANNYMTWFRKYVNTLAGKTNDLDRIIRDMTPSETIATINALNNRARKNAVYGNISSAIVQCGNFPVGMGLAIRNGGQEALQDLVKGTALYMSDMKSDNPIKNGSTFLNLRYFNLDLNDARMSAKMDRFGNFMMTALDKVSAEQMWYMFYSQGERLGVENPILYADDMVDRAIQGRRVEDMPISQQSEIIKLLAPFQVEVNNQWQVMKDLAKGAVKGDNKASSVAGLVAIMLTSAIMNLGFKRVLGREPLFDPLGAIIDVAGEEGLSTEELETKLSARVIGEVISAIPYGQYIPGLLGLDDDTASELFGESDPSRYGTGNIGLSTVVKLLTAQTDEERMKALEDVIFTYGPSGYGKQLQRFYREGQDFGYAPKYVNGEWRMDPIHYTKSGGVAFVNDPTDVFDYMRGVLGGQYNTKAGKEYIESGFKKLGVESLKDPDGNTIRSSQALQVRKMMQDVGVYDQIIEEILKGNMTPAQAGLSKTVIEMNDEEFDVKYNAMQQLAEGIGKQIKEEYNWNDEQSSAFQKALDIEADYQDGKKVTDSEALKTRKALEDAGIYDSVIDYIEANGIAYSDVGLGKRVVGYDDDKFLEIYAQKIGGK